MLIHFKHKTDVQVSKKRKSRKADLRWSDH